MTSRPRSTAAGRDRPHPGTSGASGALIDAGRLRPAWAEIDLAAIRANAALLARVAAPAQLCAVVKAGGYGHGAVEVAQAALDGGASWLAVALVEEGRQLRDAGLTADVLLLSEPPPAAMGEVVRSNLTPTVYTRAGLEALVTAVRADARRTPFAVHVKVDTGMHRVGAAPADAVALAVEIDQRPELDLQGFWTHLAVADEVDDPYTAKQLRRFDDAVAALAACGVSPRLLHAANSAGTLWHPAARHAMVRCGIALYGLAPGRPASGTGPIGGLRPDGPIGGLRPDGPIAGLRPAMALKARVAHVKRVGAGERLSYGLRYQLEHDSVIATVPLGYADGVTRSLSARGAEVLIGGRRCPLAGTVTMDQVLVDCGPASPVAAGDEAVLLGAQGSEVITAWEWATRTGTIAYEVVCGVSGRVPRTYLDG